MEATMMLCDHAEAINGKLYIMGGGWSFCPPGRRNMALALKVLVPWDQANVKHQLRIKLLDDDGKVVKLGDPPKEVVHEGQFEVGRPPNIKPGTPLDLVLAMGFVNMPLEPEKSYRWQLEIDDLPVQDVSFQTRRPKRPAK